MALAFAKVLDDVVGSRRVTVTDVTMDNSYLSGGEPVTPANLRLGQFDHAICNIKAVAGTVNVAEAFLDTSAQLLHVFDETPGEVASTNDLTGVVIRVTAYGRI
jgi:hypothetical protein